MDHTEHPAGHDHPQTFDEVIAEGFPHDKLKQLAEAHEKRISENPPAHAPKLFARRAFAAAPVVKVTREDQAALSPEKRSAFRDAIVRLVEEGKYLEIVGNHMDMSHMMHGTMGEVGLYRFLPWHRRYLLELERELRRVDAELRPEATEKIGIPYWRWEDPFPEWLSDFLPANDPDTGDAPAPRRNAAPPPKPNAADIDIIVNQFSIQRTGLAGENDYTKFTYGIEGWGRRPDGSPLPAHNNGHAWVGGIMNNTRTSPTDPVFWLHHAEIDRLWQVWRDSHPAPEPSLSGTDRIMDPWGESYNDLLDIDALGYTYDSVSL
ncbi:MAG TPA: tyrosinase family protein [Nitrosospira sp.]|nr:tyrosinase family protein [Nitrosospira sp.]